jgi:hypothetical protein
MEQYIFTLDEQSRREYLEYYVEKCQDLMTSLFSEPNTNKVLGFVEKNLRIVLSAMEKSSCMRLVGDKELPELTPNEEYSLVRAVIGLMYQYSKIFGGIPHLTTFDELFKTSKVSHNHLIKGLRDMIQDMDEMGAASRRRITKLSKILHDNMEEFGDAAGDLWEHYGNLLRAVGVDDLLLDVAFALRGHENIRFTYK